MLWLAWYYFQGEPNNLQIDRIKTYFIDPPFHFTLFGFSWVKPWPGDGSYIHIAVLGLAGGMVLVGLFYRLASVILWLAYTQMFLMERALYQNHNYLLVLIGFIMMFMPAHRAFSLDCLIRPKIRAQFVPAWTLWLLRLQVGLPYFYGGLAKINNDWLHAFPLRIWMPQRSELPIIGPYMDELWVAYFLSYAGLIFDLAIVPLLLWRRTRVVAYLMAMSFHLMNSQLFTIDVFPWFMLGATLIFFPPDWPRAFLYRILQVPLTVHKPQFKTPQTLSKQQKLILTCWSVYAAIQLLLPFRHFLYPGDVNWTVEGYHYSWRMMLNDPNTFVKFFAYDPDVGRTELVTIEEHISIWQLGMMRWDPDMMLDFAHHVARNYRKRGHPNIEIRAVAICSLNGRQPQLLIDPQVDLAKVERSIWPSPVLLPNEKPLSYPPWKTDINNLEKLPGIREKLWRPDQK